jgi:hypothetical protein
MDVTRPLQLFMRLNRRALLERAVAAVCAYLAAAALEKILIQWLRPTQSEFAQVSDAVLAVALGAAVYTGWYAGRRWPSP